MKTSEFRKELTSARLTETISKIFGAKVTLEKYNREQLEDMRNKLRTRIFQYEGQSGINDLLTNEAYQKDKAMLELLNTRIKEMLGEDIKKLKDKLQQLEEAKKGVRAPKYTKKAQGAKAAKDYDGDGKVETPKDEVWGSRAKAAAKAGKPFSEGSKPDFLDLDKDGDKKEPMKKASKEKKMKEGFDDMMKAVADRNKGTEQGKKSVSKTGHEVDRSKPGVVKATKVAPKEKDTKESAEKCNHTPKGKKCPVHGLKECGSMKESAIAEKAESKAQQQAAGIALAAKRSGKAPKKGTASAEMSKMPTKELEKFAKTKHKGLPAKKKADESINAFRRNVKLVNESLAYLLQEDEEEKAKAITAASDMANDFTSWMQRVGQYQTKVMIELSDEIRHNFGAAEAEAFKQAVGPALSSTLEVLTQQREVLSNAIAALAGEQMPTEPMGMEPSMGAGMEEPAMEPAAPDEMNPPSDEFAAADAAAGAGTPGREMRESKFARKLAESHSIIARLAK